MSTVLKPENRAEWLEARRGGIGGSDVAALFGLHPFRTALDVYQEKIGESADREPTPAMLRGRYLEDVAVELYCERTERRVRRQPLRTHPEHPFLIGTVDRQILAGDDHPTGTLEVKCPGLKTFWKVRREGLPDYMTLQGQHYALVYGYPYASYAVFNSERWELLHFDVEADAAIQERIIEAAHDFWFNHVVPRIPPEAPAVASIEMPDIGAGDVVRREDEAWARAVDDLREAREVKAEAEQLEKLAKEQLQQLAGGFGVFESEGFRLYYTEKPGRRTFDEKALGAAHPEIHLEQFRKQGKPYPEFRPYFLRPDAEDA